MKRGSRQLSVTGFMSHNSCPCVITENATPHGELEFGIGGHVTSPQQCDQNKLVGEAVSLVCIRRKLFWSFSCIDGGLGQ